MFDLKSDARQLLNELEQTAMSSTVYDTTWAARVPSTDDPSTAAFPDALDWLRRNQHTDGSWGGEIEHYHDRIISTLATTVTLAECDDHPQDAEAIQRGENYIHQNAQFLHCEPYETVSLELIVPTLLEKALRLNLNLPYIQFSKYSRIREEKLQMIPPELIYSRGITMVHSLESMGSELDVDRIMELQEENGSFGNSPSATAYVLAECIDNLAARRYLVEAMKAGGGLAVPLHPVEIFNKSWVLYNLDLADFFTELREEMKAHFRSLCQAWDHHQGIGFSRQYSVSDLDDTAVAFKLLRQAGYDLDPAVFTTNERDTHFICFPYERNASVGVHVHLLDALRTCPDYEHQPRIVEKILGFLRRARLHEAYWFDKWHISPYYVTSHAAIATIGYDDELARGAINWILDTRRHDGSWGYYRSTSEETAYCLQAVIAYHRQVESLDQTVISRAAQYLHEHYQAQDYPALWIDKCLYIPLQVVRSAVVSALRMYENL